MTLDILANTYVVGMVTWQNMCAIISKYLHSKSIFLNTKILILSYKISISEFMKILLEQNYLEMIAL